MAEGLHENGFQFPGAGGGGECRADPAVVGAEAAAGSFGGGVENAHVVGGGEFRDEALVFRDGKAGVSHVGGVDEELEIVAAEFLVDRLDEAPGALDVGESLELDGAKELDVPCGDGGVEQASLLHSAHVEFHILRNGGVEFHVRRAVHPFLDGRGGDRDCAVLDGGLERRDELADDGVLVGGVHRVRAADHHDEVDSETERLEASHHLRDIVRAGAGEKGNLDAARANGRQGADAIHLRHDGDAPVGLAGEMTSGVRHEAVDETDVCRHDAERDVGFEGECLRHRGSLLRMTDESRARKEAVELP